MSKLVNLLLASILTAGISAIAFADVPSRMSVQGKLTNGAGVPVAPGLKNFTFKIFDQQIGGAEIWPGGPGETQVITTDANGLWNAGVGALIPLTEVVFLSPTRWLQVTVDDGVNPIETLPRIELRTNPYTYRAATSERADSIGNKSYADLVDQFVDEAGDSMSGPLINTWTQKALGASIVVHNNNDGWVSWWNDGIGTWGTSSQVSGDNSFWNVAVAAGAQGNNNTNDANYGVAAYADGAGSTNIAVRGITGNSGGTNYSGYFTGGDFLVTSPQSVGSGAVQLPLDAIDNTEILDEPGIAFGASTASTVLIASSTAQDLVTVSLTLPAPGYVVVQGRITFRFTGTTAANFSWMQIDTASAGGQVFNHDFTWAGAFFHAGITNEYETATSTKVYNLSAGTYTFRVEGNAYTLNNAAAVVNLFASEILATYYPRSYGPVASPVANAGGFEHADLVSTTDPQTGQTNSYYNVDLRELELRAARTEAEAERAKRELLEAKTSALSNAMKVSSKSEVGAHQ